MAELKRTGLGLAGISYDSVALLKHFSDRVKLGFPLLSDADSAVIRHFGLLNEAIPKDTPFYGVPHPVTFIVSKDGTVTRKYFEEDYRQRQTLSGLLVKDYGMTPKAGEATRAAKHVKVVTAASAARVNSGQRILLSVEIEMRPGLHSYAPGVEGYIPVDWTLDPSPAYTSFAVTYPPSRILHLEAIKERVPVYEGRIRLWRDITLAQDRALKPLLTPQREIVVKGRLRYQACDERVCYPPETVPLEWKLKLESHDLLRAPAELQRK